MVALTPYTFSDSTQNRLSELFNPIQTEGDVPQPSTLALMMFSWTGYLRSPASQKANVPLPNFFVFQNLPEMGSQENLSLSKLQI